MLFLSNSVAIMFIISSSVWHISRFSVHTKSDKVLQWYVMTGQEIWFYIDTLYLSLSPPFSCSFSHKTLTKNMLPAQNLFMAHTHLMVVNVEIAWIIYVTNYTAIMIIIMCIWFPFDLFSNPCQSAWNYRDYSNAVLPFFQE